MKVYKLDKGMTLGYVHYPSRKFRMEIVIKAGMLQESKKEHGYAHVVEHLCSFYPSDKYPDSAKNQQEFSKMGIEVNAWTEHNSVGYFLEGLADYFETCFDMMMCNYIKPKNDFKIFKQEKNSVIQELSNMLDNPWLNLDEEMLKKIYPKTNLSLGVKDEIENVKNSTIDEVMKYRKKWYNPSITTILITADKNIIDPKKYCNKINEFIKLLDCKKIKTIKQPKLKIQQGSVFFAKTDTTSYRLIFSFKIPYRAWETEPLALDYLSEILTEGMGSRLMAKLRTELGAIYNVASYIEWDHLNHDRNFFIIRVETQKEKVHDTYCSLVKEIAKMVGFYGTPEQITNEEKIREIEDNKDLDEIKNTNLFRLNTKDLEEQLIWWDGPQKDMKKRLQERAEIPFEKVKKIFQKVLGGGFTLWYAGPEKLDYSKIFNCKTKK